MPRLKAVKTWNERREDFVMNVLRRASIRWPAAGEVRKRARVARKVNPQTGRLCWYSQCSGCPAVLLERELAVDHVDPVVPVDRDYSRSAYDVRDLGMLVARMLPEPFDLQTLCFECHSRKTEAENEERKIKRDAFKEGVK